MRDQVLKMLSDGQFVSGEAMSAQLGVTRAAIWKVIAALRKQGYDIRAVKKRGYQWVLPPDSLLPPRILQGLDTAWAGQVLEYYEEIGSTNDRAKQLGREGAGHGTLVVADMQTKGRGRMGRGWVSRPGQDIAMTLLLRPRILADEAPKLTLITALAVCMTLSETTGMHPLIKWPNDIVVDGKKVCGILLEMAADMDGVNWVIVGVGINARKNKQDFPPELQERATSLSLEAKTSFTRAQVVRAYLVYFERLYTQFLEQGMDGIMKEYRRRSVTLGRMVKTISAEGEYVGEAEAIQDDGTLLVRLEDGTLKPFRGGDVSVRGVMGYV